MSENRREEMPLSTDLIGRDLFSAGFTSSKMAGNI